MKANKGSLQERNLMDRLVLGLALALVSFCAYAHPHAWIDVRSTVVMSAEGLVSVIEEEWLFDDLYSSAVLDEMADSAKKRMDVRNFAAEVIENLGPYGYFMRITADDRPVPIGPVTQFKSEMKGQQLQLSFTAPLVKPIDPTRHTVSLSVYDPTYFIHMAHRPEDPPTIKSENKYPCQVRVAPPNPSPEDFARAFAMDRGASSEDDMGYLFAEKVHIQCK